MESGSDLGSGVIFNVLVFLCYGMIKPLDYLNLFISLGFLFMNLLFGWFGFLIFFSFLLLN